MDAWPFFCAMPSGVVPFSVARLASAPRSKQSRATSTWPFKHATHWRLAAVVTAIHLGATVKQQPHGVDAADETRRPERRLTVPPHLVDRGTAVQELPHRLDVAGVGSCVQWVEALLEERDDGGSFHVFCQSQCIHTAPGTRRLRPRDIGAPL